MSVPPTPAQALQKVPFKNVDTDDVPPCGVMQVTGSVVEEGVVFLTCAKVGSDLPSEVAVNGLVRVAADTKGVCYRHGDLPIAFDDGTPQSGENWGVRADQWTLSYGYPLSVAVHGVRDVGGTILFGTLGPRAGVVGACAAELPPLASGVPGSGTIAVHVWNGTSFEPADPAMQFTGYNATTSAIAADTLAQFIASNGIWLAASPGAPAGGEIYRATLDGDLGRSDSSGNVENIESLDGSEPPVITTVNNDLSLAGLDGDTCYIIEDSSGESPLYYFLNIQHHACP